MSWRYLTLERTQMNFWTRKRRLKFRKRWRRQHGGQNFQWFLGDFKGAALVGHKVVAQFGNVILHVRNFDNWTEKIVDRLNSSSLTLHE